MKVLYKLFRKDPENREHIITMTSGLGVVVNLLIALCKIAIGSIVSSVAILSDGIHNATDSLTSVVTLIGTKLAGKHPDEKHPFGYGRIEYLAGLVIAVMILVTGVEMMIESVKLVIEPEEVSISWLSLILVFVFALVKLILALYTIRMGKKTGSHSLTGVGLEGRNDSFASIVTIVSAIVFLVFHFSIDAYAGIITALFILKAGLEVLKETVSEIIGRPGEEELAVTLYKEIRKTEGVVNAVDMMLHNYGPDRYSGSVNVEIDHEKSVGEAYAILHALQLHIMHEYGVTMVFGIYAIDNDHEEVRELREYVTKFVRNHDHVRSYHAIYLEPETNRIYCDLIVDYKLKNWDELREEFITYLGEKYPNRPVELTVETEYV